MPTKLYKCKYCGYVQDFSPKDKEKMKKVFPEGIKINQCPSCKKEKAFK